MFENITDSRPPEADGRDMCVTTGPVRQGYGRFLLLSASATHKLLSFGCALHFDQACAQTSYRIHSKLSYLEFLALDVGVLRIDHA